MKQLNKVLSVALAIVLLLSCVYIGPLKADAAASDYIATSYAANLSVKTTKAVNLMSAPVTSSSSGYTLPAGTMLTVKALHKNTSGSYWYEVLYYNKTLYVSATATTLVDHLTGDVTVTDLRSPASLAYGNSFAIQGKITSTLNDLGTITASMRPNTNISRGNVIDASDDAGGKSYSLAGSSIDSNLVFGSLDAGIYTYVLTAEAISYYIDASGNLATSAQTVVLDSQQCVITDWTNPNDDLAFGIDVSVWQGSIDWSKVKNDVDFVILRIGFAETLDNRFIEYANGCEQYDIPYGVYLYSYALTGAGTAAEAQFVIDTLEAYGYKPELPIWYDLEDGTQQSLSQSTKQSLVTNFCDTIAAAGYQPGFYGFTSWFDTSFQNGYLSSIPVWIAQIDGFSSNGTATHDGGTWLWQYSWEGSISGIAGDVDCNICYFEYPGINSDTSYLSKCTYYPAHSIGTTNGTVNLRQYPSASYTNLGSIASGTELEITGVYKNASGEYWYQVVNGSTSGYVSAGYVTINEFLYDDLAVISPAMASNINVGGSYSLSGKLVSEYNNIYATHAKIYSGEDTQASPVLNSSYTNNSKSYKLRKSSVCNGLSFGSLSAGYYTYEISADVKNYYVSGSTLTSQTENVVVWTAPFTVGNASITPPANVTCSHNVVNDAAVAAGCTTSGLTAGSHCTKCGVVFTEQTVIPATGHNYTVTSDSANCTDYELFHYSCSKCGDAYDISADELANWSETKPLGVPASAIQTKTQYRYADCTSTKWQANETGSVLYVNSWPSGFSTSNSLYSKYNKKSSKVTASETATTKIAINSDKVTGYLYYHWCYTDSYYSVANSSGSYTTFHAYYDTTDPDSYTCDTSDMSYKTSHSTCSNTNWWFVAEVYEQSYTKYNKVPDGVTWGAWSAWSDTVYTAVENSRKVETRTMYRYTGAALGSHAWSNGVCTACGTSCTHNYVNSVCSICGMSEVVLPKDYYLFGYINGANYGCEEDYANLGTYKFVNGSLTTTFAQDSYVAVKTSDNLNWYMTNGWLGNNVTSATLYPNGSISNSDKLFVPGGVEVTFTLVDNGNNTFTLSYATTATPVLTPKYPSISIEDEVVMNVYFTASDIGSIDMDDMGILTWSTAPTDGTIDNAEAISAGVTYNSSLGYYRAQTNGIPAKNLGDTIYFRLYAKQPNGTYIYSKMLHYSVRTFANYVLNNSTDTAEKAVVVAMLNYGAAAQTYFSYKPYSLVNADLTSAQKALVTTYSSNMITGVQSVNSQKVGVFASNGGYSKKAPSVVAGGAFSINYYFTTSSTPVGDVTFYYWNQVDYAKASKLTAANATGKMTMKHTTGNQYAATVSGIAAKELDSTIYVAAVYTAANGTTYSTGVLPYSIGSFCVSYANTTDTNLKNVVQSMAVYGYYAKAYFANK